MEYKTTVKLYNTEEPIVFINRARLNISMNEEFINLETNAGAVILMFMKTELQYIILNEEHETPVE